MALFFVVLAGALVACSNLFMRKSIDTGGTTKGFLVFMMFMSFFASVILDPVRKGAYTWSGEVAVLGAVAGIILITMLLFLGKALEKGPPGFTFSLLSAATVMPGIVMFFLYGTSLGFPYTISHAIGALLVLAGIFWAGKGTASLETKRQWILFAIAMFSLHALLLVVFQWRALLLNHNHPEEISSFFTKETIQSAWFLPSMFFTAGVIQLCIYVYTERKWPHPKEVYYGLFGGLANGIGNFFLICATAAARSWENALLFPMYSVMTIILSNLWGQKLYQEKVNWKACQLSAFGLIVGLVDWKNILGAFF
ncbi:MAG: hypothetical protein FJZ64_01395 [Chlamydiae bacterium]|nr:hypothetical protein [Chlamydiota bacterium]